MRLSSYGSVANWSDDMIIRFLSFLNARGLAIVRCASSGCRTLGSLDLLWHEHLLVRFPAMAKVQDASLHGETKFSLYCKCGKSRDCSVDEWQLARPEDIVQRKSLSWRSQWLGKASFPGNSLWKLKRICDPC